MNELKVGTPFVRGDLAVVPVEAVQVDSCSSGRGICAWGFKEPAAVVLCTAPSVRAVDILGREMDLDDLADQVPGLREVIEEFSAS